MSQDWSEEVMCCACGTWGGYGCSDCGLLPVKDDKLDADEIRADMEPRPFTPEELRDDIIHYVCYLIDLWAITPGSQRGKLEGLAHSMLCIIDGVSTVPGFDVSPHSPEDIAFLKENGGKWVEPGTGLNCMLHEALFDARVALNTKVEG